MRSTPAIELLKNKKVIISIVAAIIVAVAGLMLLAARAATQYASVEPEQGTVTAPATIISDQNAAGGKALLFGAGSQNPNPNPNPNPSGVRGATLFTFRPSDWAGRPAVIYDNQVGKWYGDWIAESAVKAKVAEQMNAAPANTLPLLVAYSIPGRDCGGYSAGGSGSSAAYRSWIRQFAAGIGNRKAIVVLEPDALAQLPCLPAASQTTRLADIADAVSVLKSQTQAYVYIDAGHSTWGGNTPDVMSQRLKQAGVANAQGFSLNVSNFQVSSGEAAYGDQISVALAAQGISGKRYVVDTSRNGKGPLADQWCNPAGRGLGAKPTTNPPHGTYSDAYLWIKTIGESDGDCGRGEPAAGQWFPAYAQSLITNAVF